MEICTVHFVIHQSTHAIHAVWWKSRNSNFGRLCCVLNEYINNECKRYHTICNLLVQSMLWIAHKHNNSCQKQYHGKSTITSFIELWAISCCYYNLIGRNIQSLCRLDAVCAKMEKSIKYHFIYTSFLNSIGWLTNSICSVSGWIDWMLEGKNMLGFFSCCWR